MEVESAEFGFRTFVARTSVDDSQKSLSESTVGVTGFHCNCEQISKSK